MKTQAIAKSRRSRKNKLNRELKKELGKKLLGYSVTAGAVLTLGTATASAVAMKTTNSPVTIELENFYLLDINNDDFGDFYFSLSVNEINGFVSAFVYYVYGLGTNYGSVATNGTYYAKILNPSVLVNTALLNTATTSSAILARNNSTTQQGYFFGQRGFVGVKFPDIGGFFRFGWVDVEVEVVDLSITQMTLHGWGYETDPDTPILTGAGQESQPIPEPATLLTLAMGAAGLYAWRRNRKRKSLKNENTSNNDE